MRRRSLAKTFSWALPAGLAIFAILYLFLQNIGRAAEITGAEMLVLLAVYYAHERFWSRSTFGLENRETTQVDDPGL
jgi:bifunctional enzyme CysN/CysC/sulfate adenylyltransferase subunit 1